MHLGPPGSSWLHGDSLWSDRDSELEPERVRQTRERVEAGVVLAGLKACNGRLLHTQLVRERGLSEVMFSAVLHQSRRNGAGERRALPLGPELGILELARERPIARARVAELHGALLLLDIVESNGCGLDRTSKTAAIDLRFRANRSDDKRVADPAVERAPRAATSSGTKLADRTFDVTLMWKRQLRSKGLKLLDCMHDGDALGGNGNVTKLTFGLRVVDDRPHQGTITRLL